MATKIKHLKDEEGKFYPYTHESAVMTDDGTKLGDKLTQLDHKVRELEESGGQVGPQGPAGPQGPKGDKGDAGISSEEKQTLLNAAANTTAAINNANTAASNANTAANSANAAKSDIVNTLNTIANTSDSISEAVSATATLALQKAKEVEKNFPHEIGVDDFFKSEPYNYAYNYNGTVATNDKLGGAWFTKYSFAKGTKIDIKANSENRAIIGFFKQSFQVSYGTNALSRGYFIEGHDKVLGINAGETYSIILPEDAVIYMTRGANDENVPESIFITGGLVTQINENTKDVSELKSHFAILKSEEPLSSFNEYSVNGVTKQYEHGADENGEYVLMDFKYSYYIEPSIVYGTTQRYWRDGKYGLYAKFIIEGPTDRIRFTKFYVQSYSNLNGVNRVYGTESFELNKLYSAKIVSYDFKYKEGYPFAICLHDFRTDSFNAESNNVDVRVKLYGLYILNEDECQIDNCDGVENILDYSSDITYYTPSGQNSIRSHISDKSELAIRSLTSDVAERSVTYDTCLRGQTGGIVGDSLVTFMSGYFNLIQNYLGLSNFTNVGRGGGQVNNNLPNSKSGFCSIERMALMPKDIKLLVLYGGANDGYLFYDTKTETINEEKLGSIDDEPLDVEDMFKYRVTLANLEDVDTAGRTKTFYQAYKTWLRNAQVLFPNAMIVCVTQHKSFVYDWPDKSTTRLKSHWPAIHKGIVEVANEYGIPVCDLYNTSGVNLHNCRTRLCDDGGVFIHQWGDTSRVEAELILNTILNNAPKHELPVFNQTRSAGESAQDPDYNQLTKWLVDLRSEEEVNVMTFEEAVTAFVNTTTEKGIELKNNMYMVFYNDQYKNSRGYFLINKDNPTAASSWDEYADEIIYDMRIKDTVLNKEYGTQTLSQAVSNFNNKKNVEQWTFGNNMYMYFYTNDSKNWALYRLTTPASPALDASWTKVKEG